MTMANLSSMEADRSLLKMQLLERTWSTHKIKDDDGATRFYTGLPSFGVFMWLFKSVIIV
jgi:hypothetical protein